MVDGKESGRENIHNNCCKLQPGLMLYIFKKHGQALPFRQIGMDVVFHLIVILF